MKISIPHTKLIQALELISRVSTKHVTLPVLQCVLISAEEGAVYFRATNLELSLEIKVEGEVEQSGVIAVPATTLLQSIQYLSEKNVILRVEEGVLMIEGTQTQTSIKSIPHDEFPTIHKVEVLGVTVGAAMFAFGIKTAAFSASQTSIKPELGSVFVQQKKEHSLTFVATDSFRLMEKTVPQKGLVLQQSFLVPHKNALELARICDYLGGNPQLTVTENQCSLSFEDGTYVSSRLVSGSFPDYEQIIPKEYVTTVVVLKDDFLSALKKTNIFLNKFMQVSVALTDNHLTVSSRNAEVGHTTDTIKASVTGEQLQLNFNQQYILDPLSHIQDDSITLKFAGIGRPLVMNGVNDASLRYLVMPMNK